MCRTYSSWLPQSKLITFLFGIFKERAVISIVREDDHIDTVLRVILGEVQTP